MKGLFEIHKKDKKVIYLKAPSKGDMVKWLETLRAESDEHRRAMYALVPLYFFLKICFIVKCFYFTQFLLLFFLFLLPKVKWLKTLRAEGDEHSKAMVHEYSCSLFYFKFFFYFFYFHFYFHFILI